MFSGSRIRCKRSSQQRGYVLLTLLLIIAVMGIVAATVVTSLRFEIRRDREEEMIHRGVQYSRAIRAYYKKFNRYPAKIEDLENTNQQRFLRKRYKDPLTGKDFRLLRFGEVKMSLSGLVGGGPATAPNSPLGSNPSSPNPNGPPSGQKPGSDSSQDADPGTDPSQPVGAGGTTDSPDKTSPNQPVQTFGGMPIVGVASTSKQATIREFDQKKKYSEWQFVYDPSLDRNLLITTPYQPRLQTFGTGPQNVNGPGQNQTPGLGTSAPGTGGSFGTPTPPQGNPNQPSDTPVQQ